MTDEQEDHARGSPPRRAALSGEACDTQLQLVADDKLLVLNPAAAAVLARIVRTHLARTVPDDETAMAPLAIRGRMEGSSGP